MVTVTIIFLVLLFLLVIYIVHVRPYLERRGYVRLLPENIQSARDRLCASVRSSITILWGKLLLLAGAAWEITLQIANALNDPDLKAQLLGLGLGEWFGIALAAIGVITILARMRTARRDEESEA